MSNNENNLLSHTVIVGLAIQLVSTLSYPVSVAQSVTLFTRSRSHSRRITKSNLSVPGSTRTPCPLYGCKRVYTDTRALETHIKDHEISAQSLPGKKSMYVD